MTALLVSVRSAEEAASLLETGIGILDIKDPESGSLGRADDSTIEQIFSRVGRKFPISAALGELAEAQSFPKSVGELRYVKFGLAGCTEVADWPDRLRSRQMELRRLSPGSSLVYAAYADWQRAWAPNPDQVCQVACTHKAGAFLIDSWCKDHTRLIDWLSQDQLKSLIRQCRESHVPVALAGNLNMSAIESLHHLQPDWFAVRGLVCRRGQRTSEIDPIQVASVCSSLSSSAQVHDSAPRTK